MARISYETALKCKKCGSFTTEFYRWQRRILCQECGAYIADHDENGKCEYIANNAKLVTVKVTNKLFSKSYEEVN